jgi:uncharacterized membrane protein YhhN
MTTTAWVLLVAAALTAVVDWVAVTRGDRRTEYVVKPATLVLLVGVALALDPADDTQRAWFTAALVLSLLGDVFLMLPRDAFVPGLASFLFAHVAYIGGLRLESGDAQPILVGMVIGAVVAVARRVLRAVDRPLLVPVAVYMVVITAMGLYAVNSGDWRAAVGAVLFMASDSLIAWNRFVAPLRYARPTIMSTYHLAQALLVLSLLRQ